MNPQITVLSDFQWLMLSDTDSNQIPNQVLNSEPLSFNIPTIANQSEVYTNRINI